MRTRFRSSHFIKADKQLVIDIAPFYLYQNLLKPHLCPVTLYCKWLALVDKPTGFVFRKKLGAKFSEQPEQVMVSFV